MSLSASLAGIDTINLISLMAVVFIGLPHGAMDGALAAHFGWMEKPAKVVGFLLTYVLLAAIVVGIWLVAPVISFIVFLGISMLHFGRGDISQSSRANALMESMARGGLVIGGISLFHKAEVELIFQALVGDETGMVWLFLESIVVVTLLSIGLTALTKTGNDRGYFLAEISGLSVLFYLTPPLFGFAFYFCLVHTSRHVSNMQSILKDTISKFNIKGSTLALSLLTWAVGLVILAQQSNNVGLEDALLQVIFIGLAALTVPHMILVDGIVERQEGTKIA